MVPKTNGQSCMLTITGITVDVSLLHSTILLLQEEAAKTESTAEFYWSHAHDWWGLLVLGM